MKILLSAFVLILTVQICSAQFYITKNEVSGVSELVDRFNINATKILNDKNSEAVKGLKKDLWVLATKMSFYADKINSSTNGNEPETFNDKAKDLMTNDVLDYRLLQLDYTTEEAKQISDHAHILMKIKDDMKAQKYKINMADESDLEMIRSFQSNLNDCFAIQSDKFYNSYNQLNN